MTPLQRLMALFEGNDTHYGTHGAPSRDPTGASLKWVIKPTAKTLRGKTTDELWDAHLLGKKPLGIVPIRTDNSAIWGSIDYDVYGQDLTELIKKVKAAKLPLVPCRSKSGGLHLFCFATEPVPAGTMQDLLRDIAASIGLSGSEIFPKQATLLSSAGDQGSWMIMPYYGDTYDGKLERQVGLRENGSEIGLAEFVRIAEKARVSPSQIDELKLRHVRAAPGSKVAKKPGRGKKGSANDPTVEFGDGPPCLTHIVDDGGIKQGSQNTTLAHMIVYLKKKFPETWEQELYRMNELYCKPPHPPSSVETLVKSYRRKEYQYKCKEEPMRSYCDSMTCRKRQFGVTGGHDGATVPVITNIKKMNSEPPRWFVEVEKARIDCSTEDLQNWPRFQRLLMDKIHDPFGVIPQPVWLATIQEAMSKMTEIIEVSDDVKPGGEFHDLLETYLTNKQRAAKEDDLLSGRPWENEEEKRYYFSIAKFQRYLEREGLKGLTRAQIVTRIKDDFNGGHEKRTVKAKQLNLHWIPSDAVIATPTASTPTLKDRPI